MAKISLLLPTRGRPHLVRRLFDSLALCTESLDDLEVIVYLDDDDTTHSEISDDRFSMIKIIGPRLSMGAYNTVCLGRASGDFIMLMNDDVIVRTSAWDRMVSELGQTNPDGILQTRSLGDVWTMLSQNLSVAASSERADVAEGTIDAMIRAVTTRQRIWTQVIDDEKEKYVGPQPALDGEGVAVFQEWLIAIANDQIICIDDADEASGRPSFVTLFEREATPLVTAQYATDRLAPQLDELRNGYIDISSHCIQLFCQLIFLTDFRPILSKFFTAEWYTRTDMASIIITFRDYLADYEDQVHRSLRDLLIDSLADELLVQYLGAVRNKGVKFRRSDAFAAKLRDDLLTAFEFFRQYGEQGYEITQRWRAVEFFLRLLETDKSQVPFVYEEFKQVYRDVHISWVEAVLRSRDDFDRSVLNAVKSKAAEFTEDLDGPPDPVMGRVK